MRCPKCGYISFDHQEICKKCAKNISEAVAEVYGTAHDAPVPTFLTLGPTAGFSGRGAPETSVMQERMGTGGDDEFTLGEDNGIAFVDDDEVILADDGDELVMELEGFSDVSPREEFTLELAEDQEGSEVKPPSLDFGDLDISDLAPPHKELMEPVAASQSLGEELQLVSAEPVARVSEIEAPPVKAPTVRSTGLEDLNVSGLDLDATAKLVADGVAGSRYIPSVKTGTALDSFDIDLGDLFTENKNVK